MALFRSSREAGEHVIIALGSNQGDREGTLGRAIADIDALRELRVSEISPYYETPAIKIDGVDREAPRYLNAVIAVQTTLAPHALLDALNTIERGHGRVRDEVWGDRTLDLDIIVYGSLEMRDETLTIPHPRAWERAFVLQPWLDIEPGAVLPGYGSISAVRPLATDEVKLYVDDASDGGAS